MQIFFRIEHVNHGWVEVKKDKIVVFQLFIQGIVNPLRMSY